MASGDLRLRCAQTAVSVISGRDADYDKRNGGDATPFADQVVKFGLVVTDSRRHFLSLAENVPADLPAFKLSRQGFEWLLTTRPVAGDVLPE